MLYVDLSNECSLRVFGRWSGLFLPIIPFALLNIVCHYAPCFSMNFENSMYLALRQCTFTFICVAFNRNFFIYRDMWMFSVLCKLLTSADLYYLNSVKRVNFKFQRMLCTFAFDSKYKRRQRSQHSTENRTCYMLCILFYWKVLEKAPVWRQILSCGWVLALCIWIWTMSL